MWTICTKSIYGLLKDVCDNLQGYNDINALVEAVGLILAVLISSTVKQTVVSELTIIHENIIIFLIKYFTIGIIFFDKIKGITNVCINYYLFTSHKNVTATCYGKMSLQVVETKAIFHMFLFISLTVLRIYIYIKCCSWLRCKL